MKQHRFWAWGAVICMVMAIATGYRRRGDQAAVQQGRKKGLYAYGCRRPADEGIRDGDGYLRSGERG